MFIIIQIVVQLWIIATSGLVEFYLRELEKYLRQHQCLYVKLDPYWIYHIYDKDINPFPKPSTKMMQS